MNLHLLLNRALCDYRCIFCTMGGEHHRADQAQILADFDWDAEWNRIEQVLQRGGDDPEIDALYIMGNDPANHPDIERIIERACELGYRKVVLETNGLRLADSSFAERIIQAGARWFKIPVYGSRPEIHDAIVRLPGAFVRLQRAFETLAQHSVDVRLHSLILKQNAADLPSCHFRYPLNFRYPFRHEHADYPFSHYGPRLSSVPREVLERSDLVIPCINGRRMREALHEARVRPEAPEERDEDPNVKQIRPSKCSKGSCPDFQFCRGLYPVYFETYGEDEFEYRPELQVVEEDQPAGLRARLAELRDRATKELGDRLLSRGEWLARRFRR